MEFVENFFKTQDISNIFEKEFNNFLSKILSSKLEWIKKCQNEFEKLLIEYPKIYEEKQRALIAKYDEELKELETGLNSDVNRKIYHDLENDKNIDLQNLNNMFGKEKVYEIFPKIDPVFNESSLSLVLEEHKCNILKDLKELLIKMSNLNTSQENDKVKSEVKEKIKENDHKAAVS